MSPPTARQRTAPRALKPSQNREKLLSAARELIGRQGYAATGTEQIVREAGITRGALYYQFVDKRDLFRAVCESVMAEMAQRIYDQTMRDAVAEEHELSVGCALLLDFDSEPQIRLVLLIDGPAVLGFGEWRALQEPVSLGLLTHALEHLVEAGRIGANQVAPLADMLFGALSQAGVAIGAADDPAAAREAYRSSIDGLLEGIGALCSPRETARAWRW